MKGEKASVLLDGETTTFEFRGHLFTMLLADIARGLYRLTKFRPALYLAIRLTARMWQTPDGQTWWEFQQTRRL